MSKIKKKKRRLVEVRNLGGETRFLLWRAYEIGELEVLLGDTILNILKEKDFGIRFVACAILVGVTHAWAHKNRRDPDFMLDIETVSGWIDEYIGESEDGEEPEIGYLALLPIVIDGILVGAGMKEPDEDKKDKEEKEEGDLPPFSKGSEANEKQK